MECSPGSADAQHKLGGAVRSFLTLFDHVPAFKASGSYMFGTGIGSCMCDLRAIRAALVCVEWCKEGPEQSLMVERGAKIALPPSVLDELRG